MPTAPTCLTIRPAAPPRSLVPGVVLLVALAWVGGHFSGDANGIALQLVVVLAHVIPVGVVALALLAGSGDAGSPAGQRALLGVAVCVKAFTVFAVVWAITHPTGFGPHAVLDWLPIGAANAGSGLVLLEFLRTRRARRQSRS